jgi:Thiolase, C-terminal domain
MRDLTRPDPMPSHAILTPCHPRSQRSFAAVPMRFMAEMNVPHEKVNVNGGAIALGHPLGATGSGVGERLI